MAVWENGSISSSLVEKGYLDEVHLPELWFKYFILAWEELVFEILWILKMFLI